MLRGKVALVWVWERAGAKIPSTGGISAGGWGYLIGPTRLSNGHLRVAMVTLLGLYKVWNNVGKNEYNMGCWLLRSQCKPVFDLVEVEKSQKGSSSGIEAQISSGKGVCEGCERLCIPNWVRPRPADESALKSIHAPNDSQI